MTACLAECRAYSRNDVAVDSFTESQVAAPDSLAYSKAVPPGTGRASGVNKFFEKIKPLSDFVGAILDAAGNRISKLLGFDKIINFDNLINWETSATAQEKGKFKSVEQYLPLQNIPFAPEDQNVVLTPGAVEPSSSPGKIHFPSEETQAAADRNSQIRNLQKEWEDTLFDGPGEDDMKNFGALLCLAPEEIPTWHYV